MAPPPPLAEAAGMKEGAGRLRCERNDDGGDAARRRKRAGLRLLARRERLRGAAGREVEAAPSSMEQWQQGGGSRAGRELGAREWKSELVE